MNMNRQRASRDVGVTAMVEQQDQDHSNAPTDNVQRRYIYERDNGSHHNDVGTIHIDNIMHMQINTSMLTCIKEEKSCRYDDIGDFLESSDDSTRANKILKATVHEPLSCVPTHRRIPHHKANDWPYILEQRSKLPQDGSMTALMDYNAMLLPLYKNVKLDDGTYTIKSDLDQDLLNHITGRYHPHFSDQEADQVKYLSISRTSNLHSCKPKFKFHYGTLAQDYLGLSLLDENLQRIQGTDVAINVDKWLLGNETAVFHDFQIVAARSTTGKSSKDQLFLFMSGHVGTYSIPIDIRRVPSASAPVPASASASEQNILRWNTRLKGKTVDNSCQFGNGFEVRFMDHPDRFYDKKAGRRGDAMFKTRGVDRGKNYHFFESIDGKTYMEAWPHGYNLSDKYSSSHVTVPVNFFASKFDPNSKTDFNLFPGKKFQNVKGKRYQVIFRNIAVSQNGIPKRKSFLNDAPTHERQNMKYRGTSQIIDMVLNGTNVKVGISHTVSLEREGITDKRAYLSQFYAFMPVPPFETVALSGYFCFNHMSEHDSGFTKQWISERPKHNRTAPILIGGEKYRCPIISFASGMTDMIGHGGKNVIITYGVDDCYSRSIVVPKRKIEMLLMGP